MHTWVTHALTPSASLTSSCKQVIYNNYFLSRFHSITLDFKFSLQGGKSGFILVLSYRETLHMVECRQVFSETNLNTQHLKPPKTTYSSYRGVPWKYIVG